MDNSGGRLFVHYENGKTPSIKLRESEACPQQISTVGCFFFLTGALCLSAGRGTSDLLVYHVTIAAPYPGGIDPRLAVYARS